MMEFWERFAMAGVKSLLVLMLVDQVLAGDLVRVAGATTLHRLLGPVSTTGFASQLYGCANALIYLSIPWADWSGIWAEAADCWCWAGVAACCSA
jgi:POT family proton-dependent oligopeptide transporter